MTGLIDIQLVLTQVLGFLLLVWILGRFAWGPVVRTLEARRAKIADAFAEAERRQHEAEALRTKYEADLKGIEALKRQGIQEGAREGERVAAEMKEHAAHQAAERLARAQDDIMREREKAKELLKEQVVALSLRTAEKVIREKLDDPMHRKLAAQFVDEVSSLR